jgi:2-oxoisovalerate dehydrogenase E1 component
LAKGADAGELIAELFGRATGLSRGRGGSMHLFSPEIGVMGTSGIVGPCILQAAGAGYSFKLLGSRQVAVAFFGDGAVNNGAFHEGLNMASIWKLPVLFVCENNQFATEVPFAYAAGNPSVAARGASYGLTSLELDGNDVRSVYRAAAEAIERARSGNGPTLLECKTYRTRPHAEGMADFTYRSREDVDTWKTRCPIAALAANLIDDGVATRAQLDAIDSDIRQQVEKAREFALASPWPEAASATTHVFATKSSHCDGSPAVASVYSVESQRATTNREISYMQATLEGLSEEMAANPRIFVLGEGIGKRGGNFKSTSGLYDRYGPVRLCDTPICERGFTGLACGAAMTGTRPVVDFMFADFSLDSVGEIVNQIAKMQYMSSGRLRMPLLLRGCIGIGHSAATHHSGNYYPMYAHFPGLRVVMPATPYDAKGLLKYALRSDDPVLFLEHRELLGVKGPVPPGEYLIEFGRACIARPGTELTIVATALMLHRTLKACEGLARQHGISAEVIDPRTVAPLDIETICQSVHKTGRLLIVDEAFEAFGFGAEVSARVNELAFDDLDAPIRRLYGAGTPTPYSPTLEAAVVPNADTIADAARNLLDE